MNEVVALFATRSDADRAIEALEEMGYDESAVGYVDRHRDGVADREDRDFDRETDGEAAKGAVGGAAGGAAVGAGAGLLASAGVAMVPGIGPFLAAGTLLGTLGAAMAGAAGGAAIGGVAGAIFGPDTDDDEHAMYYREGVEQGGSLVTVSVRDEDAADVASSLQNRGAKRVNVHGDGGWRT